MLRPRPEYFATVSLLLLLTASHAARADLPGIPAVHSINASVQGGAILPSSSTAPDAKIGSGLWGWGVEAEFFLPIDDESIWEGTLGLGYNHLNLDAELGEGRRLRGALRDMPALTLYIGRKDLPIYAGIGMAISELQNGRLYASEGTDAPIEVTGNTFSPSLAIGAEWRGAFVEVGYVGRYFPSLAYATVPMGPFPADLGERMYAGGIMIRVGGTLGLSEDEDKKEPDPAGATSSR